MARWAITGHIVIMVLTWHLSSFAQVSLAASEAQLKFVPVPTTSPITAERKSRTPRNSNAPLVVKSRPSNTTINTGVRPSNIIPIRRQLVGPLEQDTGRLLTAATSRHHQVHRGGGGRHGNLYYGDEATRQYRGNNRGGSVHFGPPHGEHYPTSRHHGGDQRFGSQITGQSSRLQQVPLRENRVEVRIDDYRRDQNVNHAISIQQQPSHQHASHHQQRHFDRGDSWQNRQGQGSNEFPGRQNRPLDSSITEDSLDNTPGGAASCGPRSPCLEPNGLFPADGNCCGFVSCANCRPYTQRCAAGTVFDLDLWTCNHERDTQQCAGNNRECAHAEVNLRGDYGDPTDGGQSNFGGPQNYPTLDGPSLHGPSHNGPQHHGSSQFGQSHHSFQTRRHSSQYNSGDYGGGSRGSSWEYAAASEPKALRKSGKVPRVNKGIIASSKKKKAAAAAAA